MIRLCMKPGGSDDKLLIESLPGERKENTIIQNKPTCSWGSFAWGLCGTGWVGRQEGTGSCGGGVWSCLQSVVNAGLCAVSEWGRLGWLLSELQAPFRLLQGASRDSLPWWKQKKKTREKSRSCGSDYLLYQRHGI